MDWAGLVVLATAMLTTVALIVRARRVHASQRSPEPGFDATRPALVDVGADLPLVEPAFNPLQGLSFEDALDSDKFALNVQKTTEGALAESVRVSGFQLGNLSLQILSGSRGGFVVTFEKGSAEFVKAANGTYKAQTRGAKGAFQEIGNIDQLGTWATRVANVTAIATATANLISNADASKKLGELLVGQDKMFAYRAIDQRATLKAAYEELREELMNRVPRQDAVNSIRNRMRGVRHVLMGEAMRDLEQLQFLYPEQKGLLKKPKQAAVNWVKRGFTRAETERVDALCAFRGKLLLAWHCSKFEDIAATAAQSSEHQAVLLTEAGEHLLRMLPRYRQLESELRNVPDAAGLLEAMFALNPADGESS